MTTKTMLILIIAVAVVVMVALAAVITVFVVTRSDSQESTNVGNQSAILPDFPQLPTDTSSGHLQQNRRDTQRKSDAARMASTFGEMMADGEDITYGCDGSLAAAVDDLRLSDPTTQQAYQCVEALGELGHYTIQGDSEDSVQYCIFLEANDKNCRGVI